MSECCSDSKKLEDYHEDESNSCTKKSGAACWWSKFFIVDYAVIIVLFIASLVCKKTINPYRMYVPSVNITAAVLDSQGVPHNEEINVDIAQDRHYPAIKEALPILIAGIVFVAVCVAVLLISQFVLRFCVRRKWNILHDVHNFALGVLESLSLELVIINILKPFAGRYRPRYLAIAEAASTSQEEWEGRVSYPSGHSGTAFSSMFYCTLYLFGKTRVFSNSGLYGGGAAGRFALAVFSILPTLGAFLVAITRTRDYMHNFSDINAGAIIGILCAIIGYSTVYPSVRDKNCQLPRIRLGKTRHESDTASDKSTTPGRDSEDALAEVVVSMDDDPDSHKKD